MAAEIRLGMLNYVALMGRAVADPDLKYTPKGTPVLNFRMAVDRRYKDNATGEWKSDPSFFNIVYFGQFAERAAENLKKGSGVLVEGRLRSRSYETQSGDKRYVVEVMANRVQNLDRQPGTGAPRPAEGAPEASAPAAAAEEVDIPPDQVDDVPF
jgi:single-strand DNA-binding protein